MRASSGISSPRSPNGWPLPSQCSSSARMPSAVSGSRPSRSAISAPRSQRASISERVTCPSSLIARSRAARARNEPSGATIRSDHTNAGKARDQFERFARALGLVVVGAEQRGHLGRVRRAARVLHQQRVEQLRAGRRVEPELVGDPHPDHARPHGVPGRLALGEVERVRQPADDPRQPNPSRTPRVHRWSIPERRASARTRSGRKSGRSAARRRVFLDKNIRVGEYIRRGRDRISTGGQRALAHRRAARRAAAVGRRARRGDRPPAAADHEAPADAGPRRPGHRLPARAASRLRGRVRAAGGVRAPAARAGATHRRARGRAGRDRALPRRHRGGDRGARTGSGGPTGARSRSTACSPRRERSSGGTGSTRSCSRRGGPCRR